MTNDPSISNYSADIARDGSRLKNLPQELIDGASLLFDGFRILSANPRLFLLGMIPPLIVAIVFAGIYLLAGFGGGGFVIGITPYAQSWDESVRELFRFVVSITLLVILIRVLVNLFTIVTGLVGQPFYGKISAFVESECGDVPVSNSEYSPSLFQGIVDGIRLLLSALLMSIAAFFVGFLPVIGWIASPILSLVSSGWLQALDLTGGPLEARGLALKQRRAVLRVRPDVTYGFGVATFVAFLIPLGAVILMPAAVAGATLLARRVVGESFVVTSRTSATARSVGFHAAPATVGAALTPSDQPSSSPVPQAPPTLLAASLEVAPAPPLVASAPSPVGPTPSQVGPSTATPAPHDMPVLSPEAFPAMSAPNIVVSPPPVKSVTAGVLLWFFFAGIGAHRYYFGKTVSAAVHTGVWALCVLLIVVAASQSGGPNWSLWWFGFLVGVLNLLSVLPDVLFIPKWAREWVPRAAMSRA